MDNLQQHIEALIFSSTEAVTAPELLDCVKKLAPDEIVDDSIIAQVLEAIADKFKSDFFAFDLRVIGGGYQFFTKPEYHRTVSILIGQKEKKRLSTAALETLAIIAYKGPITKTECEAIRGVNSDYSVQKLLEKELIEVSGRVEDAVGKPILYRVTPLFLDYFGINSTQELPKLKDIIVQNEDNTIGEQSDTISDIPATADDTPGPASPQED
jgi:segregation and condensation protein B